MNLRSKATFGDPVALMRRLDVNSSGTVDLFEWIEFIKEEWRRHPAVALKLLSLFDKLIEEKRQMDIRNAWATDWPLRSEAERVFNVLDADGSRLLDMSELRALRRTNMELDRWPKHPVRLLGAHLLM